MQINQLMHFVTVIEKASFTAAAYALHISQPSLSTSIKRLEDEIGFKLIDRSHRNIQLTKEGELLYNESKKLVMHFNQVKDTALKLKENGPPHLSIGLIESAKHWTAQVVKSYKLSYPDVFIELEPVLSIEEIIKAFEDFDVHVAITNQYINDKTITSVPLYEEKLVAVLPLDNPLKNKKFIQIRDLKEAELIISHEGYQTRKDILQSFNKLGITPNIKFEIGRFDFVSDFVKSGLGVAIMPEKYAESLDHNKIHICEIEDSVTLRTVYLAYDNKRYLSPFTKEFIDLVLEYFGKAPLNNMNQ
ncbi:LysR family transcriptional regulator [Lacicoccus qingdaonensis]|uniref:DNA-binding transcriptional regulator, LysR family n=1 Tax=Lacicoccus qingdaonensis TaxID=576118 RepID=A0A1G9EN19_9BACL|nr:LysR family transcriptional regulator [Salinicoccus qingdaonensis]SDK77514.1 DNA-binding transcriptional regulator, LysR family [Salinicoccus qingdaonensis]